jgi:Ca-activated chloride channel family protein
MRFAAGLVLFGFLFLSLLAPWASAESVRGKVAEGNRHFEKGEYEEALKRYTDAQIDNPTSDVIHFNVGDALFKQEEYDKALEAFEKSLYTDDNRLAAQAYYNMGNSYFRKGDFQKAIESYQQALKLDPEDEDAKYNLEFVRRLLKQNAQQQDSQQCEKPQEQQQSGASEPQEQQQDESREPEQQKQEASPEEKEEQQEDKPQQEPAKPDEPEEGRMNRDQAMRILDAVNEEEKEQQKKQMRSKFPESRKRTVDW